MFLTRTRVMHTYKPRTSHSNNSIINVRNLLRLYHLTVTNTLHFMIHALVILNHPLVSE